MTLDYIETMRRKENLCKAYVQKADDEYSRKGMHTKEEGRYIQEAVKLQYEMAQISDGAERDFHIRRQKELNTRLNEIVMTVSPEVYQRLMAKRQKDDDSKNVNHSNTAGAAKAKDSQDEISEETIGKWFRESPKHSFEDVAGMGALKEQLKECAVDTHLSEIRKYLDMKQLHSFFFIGPPGCGKTFIIEAFAHELMQKDYKYLSVDASAILSRYVGDAEKTITRLFEEAEKAAPCILFLDEVDGVCKNRSLPDLPVWASNMTTAFLTAYNRINSSDKPIIFIGATNYPSQVDNAMLDRVQIIRVPFPDRDARAAAFHRAFDKIFVIEEGFGAEEMAARTNTYNYRDIDRLCELIKKAVLKEVMEKYGNEAEAVRALQSGEYKLTDELFSTVQAGYVPSPKEEIIRELDDFEKAQEDRQNAVG